MTDLESRIAGLEIRLRRAEDQLEIINLIASYGPLVDSGDGDGAASLWTEDGVYEVDTGTYEGRDGISGMVESGPHQKLVQRGCLHMTSRRRCTWPRTRPWRSRSHSWLSATEGAVSTSCAPRRIGGSWSGPQTGGASSGGPAACWTAAGLPASC